MPDLLGPEDLLRRGEPEAALPALQAKVRGEPADPKLRVFLFQLLCVLGEWERARDQLKALAELDPGSFPLVHLYGAAITCELLRREVFAGSRTPVTLGEPPPWLALLLQALAAEAQSKSAEAKDLRADALEQARAVPGTIDGEAFEWIADADSRLGPVCEAVIEGRYYWVPFERLRTVALEPPSDLRDVLWIPGHLKLVNGGDAAALIPVRYPGSESDPDGLIRLARKTEWDEVAADTFHGRGQRMLATNANEYSLLNVRRIELQDAGA
ncbi:MAG TPA: type VI secretion system accessory protein TagJ [Candidatus Methylomirabilis sp.]|nr:type VI secretion system accessory protein TagJ [Candidatus Methylomirabilis sp.]